MIDRTTLSIVWLELLRAQLPMSAVEVAEVVPLSVSECRGALETSCQLGYMQHSGDGIARVYRVTAGCAVPPAVRVFEILEATA